MNETSSVPPRSVIDEESIRAPFIPQRTVLVFGLILEGTLFLVALLWIWWRDLPTLFTAQWSMLLPLGFSIAGLALLNVLCFSPSPKWQWKEECVRFLETFVYPLVRDLKFPAALTLAIASGVAEELFFRGVIFEELRQGTGSVTAAHLGSSVLFSVVHFGPSATQFPRVVAIYCVAGLLLSLSYTFSGSLLVPMAVHGIYNLCAFAVLTRGFKGMRET